MTVLLILDVGENCNRGALRAALCATAERVLQTPLEVWSTGPNLKPEPVFLIAQADVGSRWQVSQTLLTAGCNSRTLSLFAVFKMAVEARRSEDLRAVVAVTDTENPLNWCRQTIMPQWSQGCTCSLLGVAPATRLALQSVYNNIGTLGRGTGGAWLFTECGVKRVCPPPTPKDKDETADTTVRQFQFESDTDLSREQEQLFEAAGIVIYRRCGSIGQYLLQSTNVIGIRRVVEEVLTSRKRHRNGDTVCK